MRFFVFVCVKVEDPKNPPKFYQDYVQAILERIRENARLEFEALWNEAKRTGELQCLRIHLSTELNV